MKATRLPRKTILDDQAMEAFLRATLDPSLGCAEIRVLEASVDSRTKMVVPEETYSKTLAVWGDSVPHLLDQAARIQGVSAYITVNPVAPALKARADRLTRARSTTTDKDIMYLRWLFLDFDAIRPTGISSTDEELARARARLGSFLADHPEIEPSCLWGCSGNGCWLLVRLPNYSNDEVHRALVCWAVDYFSTSYSDSEVEIDTAAKNPARVMPLVCTLKCKGVSTAERPHRMVTMGEPSGSGVPAVRPGSVPARPETGDATHHAAERARAFLVAPHGRRGRCGDAGAGLYLRPQLPRVDRGAAGA
jgi:hypothetical protein